MALDAAQKEILDTLSGELGKFGKEQGEKMQRLLDNQADVDARLKKLETGGTQGAARTAYAHAMHDGQPITMRYGEDPAVFIERLRESQGVQVANVAGQQIPIIVGMPRGLAGVRDVRGMMAARMMRAMALSVSEGRGCTHEGAIAVARQFWGADDPVLGYLEELRDLMRDHGGSDVEKRKRAQRILGTEITGAGASFVGGPQIGPFIDFLHMIDIMRGLGVTILPLNAKTLEMPFFDTGITVAYRTESQQVNESSPGDGLLEFMRKLLGGTVAVTNELLREASLAMDIVLRDHLALRMSSKACEKMVLGRGLAGEMRGLDWWCEQPTNAHYANRNLIGGNVTFKSILKDFTQGFEKISNEDKPITAAQGAKPAIIVSNPDFWALYRVTDTQDRMVFMDQIRGGQLLGAAIAPLTKMPTTLAGDGAGSGTNNKSKSFTFDAKSVAIAEQEGVIFNAFPGGTYNDANGTMRSGISNRETVLTADMAHDFGDLYRGKSIFRRDSVDYASAF